MFDGLLITKDQAELKRGLLSFPIAVIVQVSVVAAAILWGVFSAIELPPPMSIPIFSAPPTVAPPPPLGNIQPAGKPQGAVKPLVAPKVDPKDLVAPANEPVKPGENSENTVTDGTWNEGVDNGVTDPGTDIGDPRSPASVPDDRIRIIVRGGDVVAPKLIFSPPPDYPPMALRLGIKGRVDVEMVIDENGNVESVTVLSSSNRMFNDSVITALKKWRFTSPVDRKGQKVAIYYKKTIAFNF
jgi:TonB family protein